MIARSNSKNKSFLTKNYIKNLLIGAIQIKAAEYIKISVGMLINWDKYNKCPG